MPQPVTTAPIDWSRNPYVQTEGGFVAGLLLGLVPFGGVGYELLDGVGVLPHGTPEARLRLAVGQIVGGLALTIGGLTGEVFGGIASATGIGAAVGVPAIVVSTGLVVGGVGNIAAGLQGLSQALMSQGSGGRSPQGMVPTARAEAGTGRAIPRNAQLSGKTHPTTGVPFDSAGYPDFRAAGVVRTEVRITATGSRPGDFRAANQAAGFSRTPEGFPWHHHQDGTTMQLVPSDIHRMTGHSGGFALGRQKSIP